MIELDKIVTNRKERTLYESFYQHGIKVNRNEILPGHYYSLVHTIISVEGFNQNWIPNNENEYKENPEAYITNRPYVDMNPIGLAFYHDKWKENALMLNLKVIPPKYRAALVMTHINIIKESLDRIGAFEEGKLLSLNERKAINLPMYKITPSILEQVSGIKIGYAMSGYKLDKVVEARMLDWDKIGEVPLANIETRGIMFASGVMELSSIFDKFENKQLL